MTVDARVLERTIRVEQGTKVMMVSRPDAQKLVDSGIVDPVAGDDARYTVSEGFKLETIREFLRLQREWHECPDVTSEVGVAVVFSVQCPTHGREHRYVLPLDIDIMDAMREKMRMPKLPDDTNLGDFRGNPNIS